ncbi:hypothetical protein [Silvibacterium sp.]|uniref:hypothetical protein n=1 Tax=Silvibacterium sp. TaxID=1964179 RepID=UPI0039E3038D
MHELGLHPLALADLSLQCIVLQPEGLLLSRKFEGSLPAFAEFVIQRAQGNPLPYMYGDQGEETG